MMLNGLKARIASALNGMTGATAKFAELHVRLDELTQLAHRAASETSLYSNALDTVRLYQQGQAEEARRVSALVESQVLRVVKLEDEWMNAFGRLDRLQDDISARQSELAGTMELLRQYQKMVALRDALLNERDQLLARLQKAERPHALAADAAQVHGPRLPFPMTILPDGKPPLIRIVDIGAQNLTEEEHIYQPLVEAGAAVIVGFEPLEGPAEERAAGDPSVTMLNHFIGDGGSHKFYINQYSPTSSLLPANLEFLDRFESLATMCSPVEVIDVASTRLDDIQEVGDCDFLKIDVQGGELAVLKGATNVLAGTVAVHCEVEFAHVYKDQPLFGEVDEYLREAGFELIDIINAGYATVKGLPRPVARSRLLWAEAIYLRSPQTVARLGREKIMKTAFIAHENYGMYDVAASFLTVFDGLDGTQFADTYGQSVSSPSS